MLTSSLRCFVPDAPDCEYDINGDGTVDANDLVEIVAAWGTAGPLGDVNEDGIVNINDIMYLLSVNWHVLCE